MDELELWSRGLLTEALGPDLEWKPSPPETHQRIHDAFWKLVAAGIIPDDEADEQHWMTQKASKQLQGNG